MRSLYRRRMHPLKQTVTGKSRAVLLRTPGCISGRKRISRRVVSLAGIYRRGIPSCDFNSTPRPMSERKDCLLPISLRVIFTNATPTLFWIKIVRRVSGHTRLKGHVNALTVITSPSRPEYFVRRVKGRSGSLSHLLKLTRSVREYKRTQTKIMGD
jgi:hypothetical protein